MKPLSQVFAVPTALGVISLIGLLSALLADGLWDGLSWLTLGAVVVVATWCGSPCAARAEARRHKAASSLKPPPLL